MRRLLPRLRGGRGRDGGQFIPSYQHTGTTTQKHSPSKSPPRLAPQGMRAAPRRHGSPHKPPYPHGLITACLQSRTHGMLLVDTAAREAPHMAHRDGLLRAPLFSMTRLTMHKAPRPPQSQSVIRRSPCSEEKSLCALCTLNMARHARPLR